MKRIFRLCIFTFILISFSAFIFAGSLGYRWATKDYQVQFDCNFNTTWKNAIQNAFYSWNAVKDINPYDDTTDIVMMSYTSDGSSSSNDIYISSTSQTWVARMYEVEVGGILQSADVVFNTVDYNFTVGTEVDKFDIESIAAHELGHTIGIAHTTNTSATMYPYCTDNDISWRTLESYDKTSKQNLYYEFNAN